ncbi:V-type ATP synthase subunit I [Merdimonas faecis]|uniref:V-type ATP synthase subunit I n=1 Tax=Merdimonas faecis TaxID=1653435 RepID=A0A9D2VVW0_9FIRM|nr:V-type ATP synthase subunit I [Merdimonas faecis]HJH48683.1 V-type ATP synthase subunit I [Merdimonas faecis]
MAVLQMQRISICALKKDRKAILEKIQSMGIMEMSQVAEDEDGFEKMDTISARQSFEKKASLSESALDILDAYAPEKKSMFASLEGKKLVESDQFAKITAKKEEILEKAERIVACNKEIAEHKAESAKLENQIEALVPWLSLDVPMNCKGTGKTAMLLGTMPGETTLESVYEQIQTGEAQTDAVDVEIINSDQDATYLAVLCLKADAGAVEEALRAAGFAKPSQTVHAVPAKETAELKTKIEQLNKKIEEIEEEIKGCAKFREELKVIGDYYRMRAKKYEILGTLPQSQRTFVISGYIPKKAAGAVEKAIGEHYDCVIDIDELKEDEEPPTVLQNNAFSSSVEGVLEAYGLPHKGEFDPTTIMSFFYVFFFGMMLSDAAYGAIVAIACFVVLKKYPRMSASMHKSIKLFMFCGLSTIVWGILFSGYFGDAVDVIGRTFLGVEVSVPPLWFAPLNDPMKLLIYSMAFGLVHLFVGLGIKGYMQIKDKQYLDFFCDVVLWFIFLIGLIMMLIPSDIFASIAQVKIVFPPVLNTLAKALSIIGAVGLLLMSGRSSKNPVLRLALGAYDIYNITGWLSDVLSYSRLLALGLATGVIASVVNQMGSMLGGGIVGAIGFAIIFVIGHAMNLSINLLGAYVHTNRLQFVEFFGKFYEGGGRPFEPFETDTKYVDIKEER